MGFLSLFKNIFMDDHHDSDKMIDTSITNKQICKNAKEMTQKRKRNDTMFLSNISFAK